EPQSARVSNRDAPLRTRQRNGCLATPVTAPEPRPIKRPPGLARTAAARQRQQAKAPASREGPRGSDCRSDVVAQRAAADLCTVARAPSRRRILSLPRRRRREGYLQSSAASKIAAPTNSTWATTKTNDRGRNRVAALSSAPPLATLDCMFCAGSLRG